ncbi:taste receptor type 1 member 1-like [Parambassis ranga]|uniref:Taste receptor type 1 member 1-like n=1 Tax=Parambassis ranga TaxID=210632 RepID=A0A6P7IML4_9TELE|nr:taste receptor type 1 member 1-like [Parambassis ranga]
MKHFLSSLCLLGTLVHIWSQCTYPGSEFQLEGDYLIGGLFEVHYVGPGERNRLEFAKCSSHPFSLSDYRRFQLMRFSVEEINNSTSLLPNVSLGYESFDDCSDPQNFPSIFRLLSVNDMVQPWALVPYKNLSKVIAVVGPFSSTQALTIAPLFMADLIPMVNYGSAISSFSKKAKYPSFFRTARPNKDRIDVMVKILQHFKWRWVAFLYSDNDFGIDGLDKFVQRIKDTEICLAYSKSLNDKTDHSQMFKQIEAQKTRVVIIFAPAMRAETVIRSVIQLNVTNKVWIAGDSWSSNKRLSKMTGIQNIGTVLGVAQPVIKIPGFNDFINSTKSQPLCERAEQQGFCNQVCNCSSVSVEEIQTADPSFSFAVYSAVYAIAHALHRTLQCGSGRCNKAKTLYPHLVLEELKMSNFTLLNWDIQFDDNGDPKFGSYSIIFWNRSGDAEEVGFYKFHPTVNFYINNSKIQWYTTGEEPTSLCSPECPAGFIQKQNGIHKCCFSCIICPNGTYANITENPSTCLSCKKTEWSEEGSTSCNLRAVEYVAFTDLGAIVNLVGAGALVGVALAMCVLFVINYNTPVVRSAGGPMCFLILGCLSLCSISVFFHFGIPTVAFCTLRYLPFLLFYTVCLACFVVRSFQIVCIFKIAAKFPKLQSWWMKHHGQWLVITAAFLFQALLLLIGGFIALPKPYNETVWYPDKIVLSCDLTLTSSSSSVFLLAFLCSLCFIFSYMGKDLPKNYNEAKAITFCLLLLIFTWIIFATVHMLYRGQYIQLLSALAVLSSLYSFLLWYFLPKCYIIIFQPHRNTQQYFQGLIQNYTKTISQ